VERRPRRRRADRTQGPGGGGVGALEVTSPAGENRDHRADPVWHGIVAGRRPATGYLLSMVLTAARTAQEDRLSWSGAQVRRRIRS
jgi:hypothetical protein